MSEGFKRWKDTHATVATPAEVNRRLGLDDDRFEPDEAVKALDRIALRNAAPMLARSDYTYRVQDGRVSHILGLDQPTPERRLRAAVARAFEIADSYTDAYCQWAEDRTRMGAATIIRRALTLLSDESIDAAAAAFDGQRYSSSPSTYSDLREYRIGLASIANSMEAWSQGASDWEHEAHRPDRFLYLRLAEVYTLLFGVQAPLHQSGDRTKPGRPVGRDELFATFLTAVLGVVDWPTPSTGRDDALRGLNTKILGGYPYVRVGLDRLLETVLSPHGTIRYEDLISLGWIIDFDPKNKRGLI